MVFLRNAASVAFATLSSRILGFVRDTMVAAVLGAGPAADAFVVAFRLPSLMRRLFAEGAVNTAFIPIHREAAPEGAKAFGDEVFTLVALGFFVLTAVALLAMPLLIRLIAPGFAEGGGRIDLAISLSRITFAYCLMTALMAVASAVLNVHGRFAASAYAPALLNIVTIMALLGAPLMGWHDDETLAHVLAWAIFVGGLAQGALVFLALYQARLSLAFVRPRWTGPVRRFFVLALPGIAAAGVTQVNAFVGLVVASPEPGAVAWLYYADRIYQLPLGIVAAALGTALLPELARANALEDGEAGRNALSRAAEFATFLSLPAALALIVLAGPVVSVLFERGAFHAADSAATALALAGFAAGMPAFVGAKLLQPVFFAQTRMRLPFMIAGIGVAADIALSVTLFPLWHQFGIAIAAAISGWINFILLGAAAWWMGLLRLDHAAMRRLPRLLVAACVMAGALWLLLPPVQGWIGADHHTLQRILVLGGLCGTGFALYLAACLLCGAVERKGLVSMIRRS